MGCGQPAQQAWNPRLSLLRWVVWKFSSWQGQAHFFIFLASWKSQEARVYEEDLLSGRTTTKPLEPSKNVPYYKEPQKQQFQNLLENTKTFSYCLLAFHLTAHGSCSHSTAGYKHQCPQGSAHPQQWWVNSTSSFFTKAGTDLLNDGHFSGQHQKVQPRNQNSEELTFSAQALWFQLNAESLLDQKWQLSLGWVWDSWIFVSKTVQDDGVIRGIKSLGNLLF